MGIVELRNKVASTARSFLGRKESDGSHREIIDIYNTIRPLPGGYRMTYSDPWCAAFVSAVAQRCGLTGIMYPECSCERMIALYRQHGRWVEDDNYLPGIGDVVAYDWQDTGIGDNTGEADHVGIVVSVYNSEIIVIEGNKSDMVAYRTITRNARYIRGYCCPDYAAAAQDGDYTEIPEEAPEEPEKDTPAQVIDHTDQAASMRPAALYHDYTYRVPINLLKIGDHGPQVKSVQTLLWAQDYYHGEITGDYDDATQRAVRTFQREKNITADGEFGGETFTKLWNN